jgi:tRNA(Ser,Leu) C12 N-acetylase TAN1
VKDWNVIVTIYQQGFRRVLAALRKIGPAERSPYHNVLIIKVDDPGAALATIERRIEENTALYDAIARVAPAQRTFDFQSVETFYDSAKSILREWLPRLTGRSFHVRLHRRGSRFDLPSPDVERRMDEFIINATTDAGSASHVSFSDSEVVVVIDTIDDRAGISLWTREDLARHRLLRPD